MPNRSFRIKTIYKIRMSILTYDQEIAMLEEDNRDLSEKIEYQKAHGFDSEKLTLLFAINKTHLAFLAAQRDSAVFDLKDVEAHLNDD